MVEWKTHRDGSEYCITKCKECNKKIKSCLYSDTLVCKKCFKKAIKEVKNKMYCSKCGKEVFMGLYVERKRLFRSKTKKWCFSCYNKLKIGELEFKEVAITGAKNDSTMGDMLVGNNIIMPSTPPNRLQIPKEDVIFESYTKLSGISDNNNKKDFNIPIEMASDIHTDSKIEILSIKKSNIYTGMIKKKKDSKLKLSTFKIIDLSTGKDISKDVQLEIYPDKESKSLREMRTECFDCGNNIGFKNIPSELCLECSVYDIEKTDNKYKKR